MHLHDSYVLYTTQDAYTLVGQSDTAETLTISRGANSFSIKRAGSSLFVLRACLGLLYFYSPADEHSSYRSQPVRTLHRDLSRSSSSTACSA